MTGRRNPEELSEAEIEARLGIPSTATTRVRPSPDAPPDPARYSTTRRRVLWRDSATILIGVVLALLAVRYVLPAAPASSLESPSPHDTGLVAAGSPIPSQPAIDTSLPTIGNVVPSGLHLDATPTLIPVITLPPPTPTPAPTATPGPTATELAKEALGEEGQKAFASMNPLQRMAEPAEIAAVAAFLASPDSSFMTASEVAVDGGLAQL